MKYQVLDNTLASKPPEDLSIVKGHVIIVPDPSDIVCLSPVHHVRMLIQIVLIVPFVLVVSH